jgi:predicted DNA-binding transcriptional regulator YafY
MSDLNVRIVLMGRQKGKYSQGARLLVLLEYMRGRRMVSIAELASEFEVSDRQVRRDLVMLEEAGHLVSYGKRDEESAASLVQSNSRSVPITRREGFTLLAVRSMFDVLRGTPFFEDIENVFTKLVDHLNVDDKKALFRLEERFLYVPDGGTKSYKGKEDILDAIQTGIMHNRLVRCSYKSQASKAERECVLAPYAVVLYRHGLYVIGRRGATVDELGRPPAEGEHPLLLAVERFVDADYIPRTTFEVPPDLKVADLFQGAFGIFLSGESEPQRVAVMFDASARDLVACRNWHPSQKLVNEPDGRLRVEFEVTSLRELVPWVLQWGSRAEVFEPTCLKEEVARELAAASARYLFPSVANAA